MPASPGPAPCLGCLKVIVVILGLYWGYIGVILGLYWGYMGIIEKGKLLSWVIRGLGFRVGHSLVVPAMRIMEYWSPH